MSEPISRTVATADAGIRLDVFLANQPEVGHRNRARTLVDRGFVEVPGQRARPGLSLEAGQVVVFVASPEVPRDPLAPALPLPEVAVVYDDPCFCVIDKPAGLAAHPTEDRSFCAHTVASWALARFGDLPTVPEAARPGIVHRLDRDTTGLMVVAKTAPALESLRLQFRERLVEKEYRCIVYGAPRFQSDWIERNIGSDPKHPDRMTVVDEGGRESSTYYEVEERFAGFAHVRCQPKTGRTHQIRVHMTSIGHSLVGDRIYRSRLRQHASLPAEAPTPRRQCLHARRLVVTHPETDERMVFEAPLPADMLELLEWLRRHRAAGAS